VQRLYRPADDTSSGAGGEPDWVSVLYHGSSEATDYGSKPVATPSATLALVGGPKLPGAEPPGPVVSLTGEDAAELGDRGEPARGHAVTAAPFDLLATALRQYFAQMEQAGQVVVRLDGSTVEFVLEPKAAHERTTDAA
jgi:hypothetical protein